MANLGCDLPLMREAREAAETLMEEDPALKQYPLTALRVAQMFEAKGDTLN